MSQTNRVAKEKAPYPYNQTFPCPEVETVEWGIQSLLEATGKLWSKTHGGSQSAVPSVKKACPVSAEGTLLIPRLRVQLLSRVQLFGTHVAQQAPLSMGFPRQEYWSWLPFPPPRDLPDPGSNLSLPSWQVDSLPLSHLGSPAMRIEWDNFLKTWHNTWKMDNLIILLKTL